MKWKLKEVEQITHEKFLNYYIVTYDVEMEDGSHKDNRYCIASRHDKEHLRCVSKDYTHPDAVTIPLYYIDPESKEVSVLLTTQFRQPLGAYFTATPAGLIDEGEDIFVAAKREAIEEAGVEISDLEVLVPCATTSSGLSDEMTSIVLARISKFTKTNLEEFEDIKTRLVPLKEVKKMLQDPQYFFPVGARLVMMLLLERFHMN